MLIVSYDGILVNKDSASELVMQCVESEHGTSSANANESFKVNKYNARGVTIGIGNLGCMMQLCDGVKFCVKLFVILEIYTPQFIENPVYKMTFR